MKKYYKLQLRAASSISFYICTEGLNTWYLHPQSTSNTWNITGTIIDSVEARFTWDIEEITEKYLKLRGKHLTNE